MSRDVEASDKGVTSSISRSIWFRDAGIIKLNFGICFMFASSASVGYTASLINGLLVLPYFVTFAKDFSPELLGLTISAAAIGNFVSFVPGSYMADIFGRKLCVGLGSVIVVISAVIQAIFTNKWAFICTRIFAGVGGGFASTAAPLLVTEVAHPHMRQSSTALYNSMWYLGSLVSAAVSLFALRIASSWSWRLPCLLQTVFPLLQLVGLFFIPESPRWLVANNQKMEALTILTKCHANGVSGDNIVQNEFEQMCESILQQQRTAKQGWQTFFSSRGHIHILAICIMIGIMAEWAGNGIMSYYLAPTLSSVGIKEPLHQAAVNLSIQAWNLFIASIGSFASEKYGRRPLWLLTTVLMLLFLAIITLLTGLYEERGVSPAGITTVPFLFLFFAAYDLGYTPMFIAYPAEILPFKLRAKGMAITLLSDSVAAFSNQYVNPVAFTSLRWRYYCVFLGCLTFFFVSIYFFFPETKGRPLEEVSGIFNIEDSAEPRGEEDARIH
ncbi:hypothetical protein N7456_007828 [Penicillium angulare]|uniref:Major facilitator superfamily (MFS) profile domain-containing protein n=1 Tax=Penicillium angulare TaxID=116970 RepID=A0A9W9FBE7_9EURO|nr:hypothetical protein N7456_007828 [Penicillium angulare]